MVQHASEPIRCVDGEVAVSSIDPLDVLVLPDVQIVVLGHLAVVFQRLVAIGLLVRAGEGHVADLKQLRRGEKRHVRGVVEEGVAEAALVDQKRCKACTLRLDRAGQPGRACPDYQQINYL